MDYIEQIQEYLDGTLSPEAEQELFTALSSSEELRTELKQAIEMDKGLSKRVSAFVPTSASTMSIFTQLGIGTAAGAAATAAAMGFRETIMAFLTTHSAAIISTIVGIALTAGSFLAFYNPPDESTAVAGKQNQEQLQNNLNNANNKVPIVIAKSTGNRQVHIDTVIRYVTRNVYITRQKDEIVSNDETNQEEINPESTIEQGLLEQSEPVSALMLSSNNTNYGSTTELTQRPYQPMAIKTSDGRKGIAFEVKGNGYWTIPQPDVPLYDAPAFANMQLSALYSFSEKFKAGVDFRQESFYQNFTGTNEIGEEFEYKQYPNYYTVSLMGRYSFWSNNLVGTFAQATLGGTATGAVGRLMLGIELSPNANLSFLLGLEGSMLLYKHQNNLFTSPKIGLSYGVAFNF